MNWQDIKISSNNRSFSYNGVKLFGKTFLDALKFHSPGIASVKDESGSYHIDISGNELYSNRYNRTFGYYCYRASVVQNNNWFHLNEKGERVHPISFCWTGNYQENFCPVRDNNDHYFHIDLNGKKTYIQNHLYAGDYKDGIACVKTTNGFYKHIDTKGNFINKKSFIDLGVFHKNFAIAKDENGWHHIGKNGVALYSQRYLMVEPFYNGFSVVETFQNRKQIINELGNIILEL